MMMPPALKRDITMGPSGSQAIRRLIVGMALILTATCGIAHANEKVTCESRNNHHEFCKTQTHGYVTLVRQLSNSPCRQGRTWDYDRRGIWVDDGCRAEFEVESSNDHSKSTSRDAKVAAGVLVGAAILGALVNNKDHDDAEKYKDENYYGGRHTSYVPGWMIGHFKGYNPMYGVDVDMKIHENGRVKVVADGQEIKGYINDERLHVGSTIFDIDRTRGGFVTSQVGDRHNEVRYHRVQ